MTPAESRILRLLAINRGQALAPEFILDRAGWDYDAGDNRGTRTIATHVYHLRDKLARASGHADLIRTVPGAGYALIHVRGPATRKAS